MPKSKVRTALLSLIIHSQITCDRQQCRRRQRRKSSRFNLFSPWQRTFFEGNKMVFEISRFPDSFILTTESIMGLSMLRAALKATSMAEYDLEHDTFQQCQLLLYAGTGSRAPTLPGGICARRSRDMPPLHENSEEFKNIPGET